MSNLDLDDDSDLMVKKDSTCTTGAPSTTGNQNNISFDNAHYGQSIQVGPQYSEDKAGEAR